MLQLSSVGNYFCTSFIILLNDKILAHRLLIAKRRFTVLSESSEKDGEEFVVGKVFVDMQQLSI